VKALVVYDSVYGNTDKIAKAIGGAIAGEAKVVRPNEVNISELGSFDLLIVGAPTQGGRATKAVQDFVSQIPASGLKNVKVTAFDTRMKMFIAKLFGYAADRIAGELKTKGGTLAAPPVGFIVKGREGPLEDGEIERAAKWGQDISRS
jgi:flavodoxin I